MGTQKILCTRFVTQAGTHALSLKEHSSLLNAVMDAVTFGKMDKLPSGPPRKLHRTCCFERQASTSCGLSFGPNSIQGSKVDPAVAFRVTLT